MVKHSFILTAALCLAISFARAAEFQVHTNAVKDQEHVAVTQLTNGTVVLAWEDEASGLSEIWFRPYDSNLVAQGAPVRAHNTIATDQAEPAIAPLTNGFVIVWSGRNFDGSDYGIAYRRFDSAGNALDSNPLLANTTVTGGQLRPRVAALTGGGFIIVWSDQSGAYSAGASQDVRYRRFNGNGTAADAADLVANAWGTDAHLAGDQGNPRVAALPANGFVIVYEDRQLDDVFAVVFDGAGNAVQVPGASVGSRQRLVNQLTAFEQTNPDVASFANGSFVVSYNSETNGTPAGRRVLARFFPPAGGGSNEFVLGSFTNRTQDACVTALSNGTFIATMQAAGIGVDASSNSWSVLAQRCTTNGSAASVSFIVNSYQPGDQDRPAAGALRDGSYLVAWQSFGQDTNRYGIYAQRYTAVGEPLGRLYISRQNPIGTNFLVSVSNAAPYVPYRLQASPTLTAPWTTLLTTNTSNTTFQYSETKGGVISNRGYRVISP